MSASTQPPKVDEFLDLPLSFRPVAQLHGREMFQLVVAAGMCSEAAERLSHSKNPGALVATRILADNFNQVANALVAAKGWTEEQLAHCDRDITLAYAGKVQTVESKIILDS